MSALRPRSALRGGRPLVVIALLALACTDGSRSGEVRGDGADADMAKDLETSASLRVAPPPAPPEAPAPQFAQQAHDPMLIRTGAARVEVDSIHSAVVRVESLAARVGGTVMSSMIQTGARQRREASISLSVPAARFDEAVNGLGPVGRLESLHVNTEDVGEEFVDLSARLASARQLEQRLLEILQTRTGRLEEVLALERELARVRAEIERYEGRIRYLRSRVEMSVLAISLHEPEPTLATPPGVNVIGEALKRALRNFVAVIAGGIAALGFLLPLAAVAGAALLVGRRLRRARVATVPGPAGAS